MGAGQEADEFTFVVCGMPKNCIFYEEHGKMRLNKNHGVGGFSHDFGDKKPHPRHVAVDTWGAQIVARKSQVILCPPTIYNIVNHACIYIYMYIYIYKF
jgi:hypothetical protein